MSRVWFWFALFVLPLVGAGCGGGGSGGSVVTPLPQALAITAVSPDVGGDQVFTSSLGATAAGLRLRWDFGDGSAPVEAPAPTHRYAASGDYTVVLTVTNEAGESTSAQRSVSVRRMALVAGLGCTGPQQSGWCAPAVNFTDSEEPLFFGANTVFRRNPTGWIGSDDGGRTFTSRSPAGLVSLSTVHAPDAQNAWMVWKDSAGQPRLSRTADGGRNWSTLRALPAPSAGEYGLKAKGQHLLLYQANPDSCRFPSPYCISSGHELSNDGGMTWTVMTTGPGGFGFNLSYAQVTPSGSVAWHACNMTGTGFCRSSSAFRVYTVESGLFAIPSPYTFNRDSAGPRAQQGDTLVQIIFPLETSDVVLWRSTDGGRSWATRAVNPSSIGIGQASFYQLGIRQRRCGSSTCELLEFFSDRRYTSTDGGSTWAPAEGLEPAFERLDLLGEVLYHSAGWRFSLDAGATWRPLPARPTESVYDRLVLNDSGAFWFVNQRPGSAARYYRSLDIGLTWTLNWERKTNADTALGRVWVFADGRVVSLRGESVFESTDRGSSWDLAGTSPPSNRLVFFDSTSGAATNVPSFAESAGAAKSTDGGRTWTAASPPSWGQQAFASAALTDVGVDDMQVMPDGTLWLAGYRYGAGFGEDYAAWRLAPGAVTWERVATMHRVGVGRMQFVDAKRVYLLVAYAGLGLQRSDDGGLTWKTIPLEQESTLKAFFFVNVDVGWIVGDAGRVLHTRDGGATWTEQQTGTSLNFYQVAALDPYTVWLAGTDALSKPSLLLSATGGR